MLQHAYEVLLVARRSQRPHFRNCTLVGNKSTIEAALSIGSGTDVTLINSVLWDNDVVVDVLSGTGNPLQEIRDSIIQDGYTGEGAGHRNLDPPTLCFISMESISPPLLRLQSIKAVQPMRRGRIGMRNRGPLEQEPI